LGDGWGDGFDGICLSSKLGNVRSLCRNQASYSASVVPKRDTNE
jgi:hypothetical protein